MNSDPSQWIIISLIIVGFVACGFALLWTKIIKPNDFCYTTNNLIVKNKIKKQLIDLINSSVLIKYFYNISIKTNKIDTLAINNLFYSKKQIYFISDALYYNIVDVCKTSNEIKAITKRKAKELIFPGSLQLFISGCRTLNKSELRGTKTCIIVPCLNKDFQEKNIDNIHFIKIENVASFITKNEKLTKQTKLDQQTIKQLEEKVIINKKKLFFKFQKNIFTK